MSLPAVPSPGSEIPASWGRDVVSCLESLQIRRGVGYRIADCGRQGIGIEPNGPKGSANFQEPRLAPPKMLTVGCKREFIYVRNGKLQWAYLTLPLEVHDDDWDLIWQDESRTYIDCTGGWMDDPEAEVEPRFLFMETKQSGAPHAYLRFSDTADMPTDDPIAKIIRWPIAQITGAWATYPPLVKDAEPEQVFQPSIVEILADGLIKIPAAYGPPQ